MSPNGVPESLGGALKVSTFDNTNPACVNGIAAVVAGVRNYDSYIFYLANG